MDLRELQLWFETEELDPCPRCGRAAALGLEHADALLCFRCGFIRWRGGTTSVRELQRPQSSHSAAAHSDRNTATSGGSSSVR